MKPNSRIIADSVQRPRLVKIGGAMFFGGLILLLIISALLKRPGSLFGLVGRGNFNDLALFVGAGVLFSGWVVAALGLSCPVCDSSWGKNGICRGCGRNGLERYLYIDNLKKKDLAGKQA
jgi:hypothetical protein